MCYWVLISADGSGQVDDASSSITGIPRGTCTDAAGRRPAAVLQPRHCHIHRGAFVLFHIFSICFVISDCSRMPWATTLLAMLCSCCTLSTWLSGFKSRLPDKDCSVCMH